jgi:hypothetical protein
MPRIQTFPHTAHDCLRRGWSIGVKGKVRNGRFAYVLSEYRGKYKETDSDQTDQETISGWHNTSLFLMISNVRSLLTIAGVLKSSIIPLNRFGGIFLNIP